MKSYFSERRGVSLDPIMALDELFRKDPASNKINLVVGVFQNHHGETPVLGCVKAAEARLNSNEQSKAYLPIAGDPAFLNAVESLIFGPDLNKTVQVSSLQTPGSTAALRIAAEFVREHNTDATVWVSKPAYSNHKPIFQAAGLRVGDYRYYDVEEGRLTFDEMIADLSSAPPGDVVLLHACCHNPTGADLSLDQWRSLARLLRERSLLPLLDAAYLGLRSDVESDAAGIRELVRLCPDTMVAASFSKNFALYSERVGTLSMAGQRRAEVLSAVEKAKVLARIMYTSPPSHGARLIAEILTDHTLRMQWMKELVAMRDKLIEVRLHLADGLDMRGVGPRVFPSLRQNRGMFTLSTLTSAEVSRLRERHHVYILENGRVSFGGMRRSDIVRICDGLSDVITTRAAA